MISLPQCLSWHADTLLIEGDPNTYALSVLHAKQIPQPRRAIQAGVLSSSLLWNSSAGTVASLGLASSCRGTLALPGLLLEPEASRAVPAWR